MLKFHCGDVVKVKQGFKDHKQGIIYRAIPQYLRPTYCGSRLEGRKYFVKFHDGTMLDYPYQRLELVRHNS